jgi:hypothetical protein
MVNLLAGIHWGQLLTHGISGSIALCADLSVRKIGLWWPRRAVDVCCFTWGSRVLQGYLWVRRAHSL